MPSKLLFIHLRLIVVRITHIDFHILIKCYHLNNRRPKAKNDGILVVIKEPFNRDSAVNEYEWEQMVI